MKKIVALVVVILVSSVSVFANNGIRPKDGKKADPSQRCEKMVSDLDLNEKQAADFKKIQSEYQEKVKTMRDKSEADRQQMKEQITTMRTEKNAEIKKILTDEQYQKYEAFAQKKQDRQGKDGKCKRGKGERRQGKSNMDKKDKPARSTSNSTNAVKVVES